MSEHTANPDIQVHFAGLTNLEVIHCHPSEIPLERWSAIQQLHREHLRSQTPHSDWERIDDMVHQGNLNDYITSRVNPNHAVGDAWQNNQLYRKPLTSLVLDGTKNLLAVVQTADNTSGNHPIPFVNRLLRRAKMVVPPDINLPTPLGHKLSGKRYVHLREALHHPDALPASLSGDRTVHISGLTLAGIYHALTHRFGEQTVAAYVYPEDPADSSFNNLTAALQMQPTGRQTATPGPYRGPMERRTAPADAVQETISNFNHAHVLRRINTEFYHVRFNSTDFRPQPQK